MSGAKSTKRRFPKFFTLRFRGKVLLGFAVVLLISTVSLGIAYLGFQRVSAAVSAYRNSVSEADLARNIESKLISYRSLVQYYVVTGKDDDAKAALSAEQSLKSAIDQALGSTKEGSSERLNKLAAEFKHFSQTFADVLNLKNESALVTQNQLKPKGELLLYKLQDMGNNASAAGLSDVQDGTKKAIELLQAAVAVANNFVINSDQKVATNAQARLKFLEFALHGISATNDKIA